MSKNGFNLLKRVLFVTLLTVLVACLSLLMSACECQHEYESEITTAAGCGTDGEITYTCVKCGDVYTEVISATGEHELSDNYVVKEDGHIRKCGNCTYETETTAHSFTNELSRTPSTCTTQGTVVSSCVCGLIHTDKLPLAEHSYTKTVYDDDAHWLVCSVCGTKKPNQDPVEHSFVVNTTTADCEHNGKTVITCSGCTYTKTETQPALGHDLDKSSFSSSSTANGHYYKCNRCSRDVLEAHTLVDCDCPDGYNREATCYREGHQDRQCTVCNWRRHETTPKTDEHDFSTEWSSNGTHHWHACLNGNGECTVRGGEAQHVWVTKTTPATCEQAGREWRECECGAIQSGSIKVLPRLEHDYDTVTTVNPTCTKDGSSHLRCKDCGYETDVKIKATGHSYVEKQYVTDRQGHRRKCDVCGEVESNARNHNWDNGEVISSAVNCGDVSETKYTCTVCKYSYIQTAVKNHNYLTDPDSYIDATCTKYGSHVEVCSSCGDEKTVIDERLGYAEHKAVEHAAKEMTETEPGNRHYWQCTVCLKYFTSHGCVEELTEDQVFTYPPKTVTVDSVGALIAFAADLPEAEPSVDKYQITATVKAVSASSVTISDGTGSIYVWTVERENIETLRVGLRVTVKGALVRIGDEATLDECVIVSCEREEGKYSLFIAAEYSNGELVDMGSTIVTAYNDNASYTVNSNNYNCLTDGEVLNFTVYNYNKNYPVLQKVIVNGKSMTVNGYGFTLTADKQDVDVKFLFGTSNRCSVKINQIDTTVFKGNVVAVDEYVSYEYNGGVNPAGRLYKDSHLTFTVNNANITGINITYDADWLDDNPTVIDNVITAIKASGSETEIEQVLSKSGNKVVLTFNADDGYVALDYFANAVQARVTEIVLFYETSNVISQY